MKIKREQAIGIGLTYLCLVLVGCGTAQPTPTSTATNSPTHIQQSITPAVTIPPSATATSVTNTPIPPPQTPFERRPLPATWTPTFTPTATDTLTPTNTPTITHTPSITPTRTIEETCEKFRAVPLYDPDIIYPPQGDLPFIFNADDSTMTIVFEAIERKTGEVVTFYLPIDGAIANIGYISLEGFAVFGTYDWTFYLETADGQAICHGYGTFTIREATLFDLIRTAQPTLTPTP